MYVELLNTFIPQKIPIRAEVIQLENTSAHADQQDMLDWLSDIKKPPKKIFVTHGENKASESLKEKVEQQYKWNCIIPPYLYEKELI